VEFEYPLFEIVRVLRIRFSARHLQLWYLTSVAVSLGELLDSSSTDIELLGNQGGVNLVINDSLTNRGNIVLVKFHLVSTGVG